MQAPLKVQRPFYPEGEQVCHSVMLHTAGGMVGGDRLSIDLHLHPDTKALLTTAAAAKVYRSQAAPEQDTETRQTISIQVDAGACLEWLPQETIVFNGAIYRQNLRVELAPTATWLGWEMTRLGRSARGEKFLQGNWRSHTEIWRQGKPLWIDPQSMMGDPICWDSPHDLAGQPVVASFALVGQPISSELVAKARLLWENRPSSASTTAEVGVTRLIEGLLCRYRGPATSEARTWFIAVWHLLRSSLWHRPACPPRVWTL